MDLKELYEEHLEDAAEGMEGHRGSNLKQVSTRLGAERLAELRALVELLEKTQADTVRKIIDEAFVRRVADEGGGGEPPAEDTDTLEYLELDVAGDWPDGDIKRLDRLLQHGNAIGNVLERLARDYDLSKTEMLVRVIETGIKVYVGSRKGGRHRKKGEG